MRSVPKVIDKTIEDEKKLKQTKKTEGSQRPILHTNFS